VKQQLGWFVLGDEQTSVVLDLALLQLGLLLLLDRSVHIFQILDELARMIGFSFNFSWVTYLYFNLYKNDLLAINRAGFTPLK
jgi:hypothetical protein